MAGKPWTQEEVDYLALTEGSPTDRARIFRAKFPDSARTTHSIRSAIPVHAPGPQTKAIHPYSVGVSVDDDSLVLYQWLRAVRASADGIKTPKKKKSKSSSNPTLTLLFSDWHIRGPDDIPLVRARIKTTINTVITQAIAMSADRIAVLLLGDMVDGEGIHPAHHAISTTAVIRQTQLTASLLYGVITALQTAVALPVNVICVAGNHGRAGHHMHPASNWDTVTYLALAALLNGQEKISIDTGIGQAVNIVTINGKRVALKHRTVKHLGTPAMKTRLEAWASLSNADIICCGHFHHWECTYHHGITWVMGGTAAVDNRHALESGFMYEPSQGFFFIDIDRAPWGFTAVYF